MLVPLLPFEEPNRDIPCLQAGKQLVQPSMGEHISSGRVGCTKAAPATTQHLFKARTFCHSPLAPAALPLLGV